jgi:hypothetical protein
MCNVHKHVGHRGAHYSGITDVEQKSYTHTLSRLPYQDMLKIPKTHYANAAIVFENFARQEEAANQNLQSTFEPGELSETHATAAQSVTIDSTHALETEFENRNEEAFNQVCIAQRTTVPLHTVQIYHIVHLVISLFSSHTGSEQYRTNEASRGTQEVRARWRLDPKNSCGCNMRQSVNSPYIQAGRNSTPSSKELLE